MSSAPDDPLAMFTSASWQCPVCDRPGDLHDERCLVLEIAQIARRRKDGNRRLVQTNGRLRELASHESDEIVHWREQFEAMSFERDAAEAEVRRLTEGLRETEDVLSSVGNWLAGSPEPTAAVIEAIDLRIGKNRALLAASPTDGGGAK